MSGGGFFQSSAFKILVFPLGTVVLAAIFAPLLYWGGKHVVAEGWLEGTILDGLNGSLDRARFSRYFNRAVLLGALLMLWPVLRWMNAGRKEKTGWRAALMLEKNPAWIAHLLIGFLVAGGSLLLLGWFYVSQGWYETRDAGKQLSRILVSALGTGIAVGLLEEFVFRGALHSVVSKILRPKAVFFTIAVFFAVIHFFNAPRHLEVPEVTATTGFWFVGEIFAYFFSQFADPYFLLAEFAVLFAIGLVLGYTRMATNSLWLGIGLHAGWVFGVKVLSPLTQRTFDRAEMMPWLGDSLRVGLVSCLVVTVTGIALWLWLRRKPGRVFSATEP